MPAGLERRYGSRSAHFITCSCYRRQPLLSNDQVKRLFLTVLEEVRQRYRFCVIGYVIMPEHFHLLISKPEVGDPSIALQVLKQRVSRKALGSLSPTLSQDRRKDGAPKVFNSVPPTLSQDRRKDGAPRIDGARAQFWQRRFYDFSVWSAKKRVEKLRYMHRNPVKRGLVKEPGDWPWSSFRHYAFREIGVVEIESEWTARDRELKISGGPPRIFLCPG
jgi:putative transposase